jgi:hypothetical protein
MLSGMVRRAQHREVRNAIVQSITINMVNMLASVKLAAKVLFHKHPMLVHPLQIVLDFYHSVYTTRSGGLVQTRSPQGDSQASIETELLGGSAYVGSPLRCEE